MTRVTQKTFDRQFTKLLTELYTHRHKFEILELMEQQLLDDDFAKG